MDQALSELDKEIATAAGGDLSGDDLNKAAVSSVAGKNNWESDNIVEDAPIIKIVAVIIRHATNQLDIHIENVGDRIKFVSAWMGFCRFICFPQMFIVLLLVLKFLQNLDSMKSVNHKMVVLRK